MGTAWARHAMCESAFTGYPLHSLVSPSLLLPCVTVCHHISTGLFVVSFSSLCSFWKATVTRTKNGYYLFCFSSASHSSRLSGVMAKWPFVAGGGRSLCPVGLYPQTSYFEGFCFALLGERPRCWAPGSNVGPFMSQTAIDGVTPVFGAWCDSGRWIMAYLSPCRQIKFSAVTVAAA